MVSPSPSASPSSPICRCRPAEPQCVAFSHARLNNATDLPQLRAGSASQLEGLGFQGERCAQVNRPVDPNNPPQPKHTTLKSRSSPPPYARPSDSFTTAGASHSPGRPLPEHVALYSLNSHQNLRPVRYRPLLPMDYGIPPRCGANAHRLCCHRICGQEPWHRPPRLQDNPS